MVSVVTGAFGFTGRHIAARLIAAGERFRTLTAHPERPNPFGGRVEVAPLDFGRPDELVENLRGADVLYNTYWIRFPHGQLTFEKATENSQTLIRAAEDAGVRRIVHVSIANHSEDSPLGYYRGKARVEKMIRESSLSYAILRPAVIFGDEGLLINNIAWMLRKMPLFVVPGRGDYKLQPVFVEDLSEMAVRLGRKDESVIVDAVGPETYTFNDLLARIARAVGSRALIIHLPPEIALYLSRIIGEIIGDVILTRDEVKGLMADLLASDGPPTGRTRLSDWLTQNADLIGAEYVSELKRHYR